MPPASPCCWRQCTCHCHVPGQLDQLIFTGGFQSLVASDHPHGSRGRYAQTRLPVDRPLVVTGKPSRRCRPAPCFAGITMTDPRMNSDSVTGRRVKYGPGPLLSSAAAPWASTASPAPACARIRSFDVLLDRASVADAADLASASGRMSPASTGCPTAPPSTS